MKKIFIIISVLFLSGCNNWLDVKPEDRLSEDETFSTLEGFKNTLNAIYIELNDTKIYGGELTVGYIEVLANRYCIPDQNKSYFPVYEHNYTDKNAEFYAQDIWEKHYELIANLNIILKHCDRHPDVLKGVNYNIIKGEALALRGFLQFELARLFGPIYSADALCLPYYTEFNYTQAAKVKCSKYMELVLSDFTEAKKLLEEDPIITTPPTYSEDVYNYLRNRTYRMNYFAVTLLRARAYLWMNDKPSALADAKEVIAAQPTHYPFATEKQITDPVQPDRVLSSELIFALENNKRGETIFKNKFSEENVAINEVLAPLGGEEYDYILWEDYGDLRRNSMTAERNFSTDEVYYISYKYKDVEFAEGKPQPLLNRIIPMLRVSEAFYIAAECEEDEDQALEYLNKIIGARIEDGEVYSDLEENIQKEYLKEFIGEGQMFYYYKRKNIPTISNGHGNIVVNMSNAYVIPIPLSEKI